MRPRVLLIHGLRQLPQMRPRVPHPSPTNASSHQNIHAVYYIYIYIYIYVYIYIYIFIYINLAMHIFTALHGIILTSFIALKPLQEVEVVVGIIVEIGIPVHPAILTVASFATLIKVLYLMRHFHPNFACCAPHPWHKSFTIAPLKSHFQDKV